MYDVGKSPFLENTMTLSQPSLEILLDLIEIKVNALQIQDRDDMRELNKLRKCRQELLLELSRMNFKRTDRLLNPSALSERSYKKPTYSRY
jgi:hypothetical protein